ncbi:MAG: Gfo/Idh/MocA family oxidoreductase [Adlercreutzia sp.]|nr:Gfo/Idh/MocA family oxidoreductase [Adlercreutzia sp.]
MSASRTSLIQLGIIGTGRIARKFVNECRDVEGVEFSCAFNPGLTSSKRFCEETGVPRFSQNLTELLESVDAVYVASPHDSHVSYIRRALDAGCHVLSEKPLALTREEVEWAYSQAQDQGLVLVEGIKVAFLPAIRLVEELVLEGRIGEVVDVDASFTKLMPDDSPELDAGGVSGAMTWLSSYPLFAISRFLGTSYKKCVFCSYRNSGETDGFTRGLIEFDHGVGSFRVGFRAKTDGALVISGTKGYVLVPAPWWNARRVEVHYEDPSVVDVFNCECIGSGLRYELEEFIGLVRGDGHGDSMLSPEQSGFIAQVIEDYRRSSMVLLGGNQ